MSLNVAVGILSSSLVSPLHSSSLFCLSSSRLFRCSSSSRLFVRNSVLHIPLPAHFVYLTSPALTSLLVYCLHHIKITLLLACVPAICILNLLLVMSSSLTVPTNILHHQSRQKPSLSSRRDSHRVVKTLVSQISHNVAESPVRSGKVQHVMLLGGSLHDLNYAPETRTLVNLLAPQINITSNYDTYSKILN